MKRSLTAIFLLIAIFCFELANAQKERMSAYPQEDISIHEQSLVFLKKGFPPRGYNGSWIGKSTGKLLVSSGAHYRHMPAMLVAAFSSPNKTDSENAFKWLESYQCENILACEDYEQFLSAQIKSAKGLNGILKIKADVLLTKAQARLKDFANPPQKIGFCPSSKEAQENWLKLAYQLYCPPYDIANNPRGCAMLTPRPQACSATEGLVNSLGRWSGQLVLSSSRLMNFEHSLQRGCEKQWSVSIDCEVNGQKQKLAFDCENQSQKYPAQVVCKSKSH